MESPLATSEQLALAYPDPVGGFRLPSPNSEHSLPSPKFRTQTAEVLSGRKNVFVRQKSACHHPVPHLRQAWGACGARS